MTTKKYSLGACALALLIALPAATSAAPRDEGGRRTAPAVRPAPVGRSAPAARPAPVQRAASPARAAPPSGGGFNFNHDINARPAPPVAQQRPAPPPRPAAPQRPVVRPQRPVVTPQQPGRPQPAPARPPNRPAANYPHAPNNTNTSGGPYRGRFTGPVVRNTRAPRGNWGWNHGVVWRPAPVYWGGGFWGPFALAALTNSLLFGSIIDDQDQLVYPSYQIQPDTPGAELLQDYELQQEPCGPPDLVVIWGPDNSVICAMPNGSVGPGNYEVDPTTFTLVPASS